MRKNSKSLTSNPSDSTTPDLIKPKTVFDHINQIREVKDPNYFKTLSDVDQKSFNKYIILMGLGMDPNSVGSLCYLSKYFDVMSNESFYRVCCDMVPKGKRFHKWIKSTKPKFSKTLLDIVARHYQVGRYEAYDYCTTFFQTEANLQGLISICSGVGYDENQIEKLLEGKDE